MQTPKTHEIEAIIEHIIESTIVEAFEEEFTDYKDIEYALTYLKSKINDLETDDFV